MEILMYSTLASLVATCQRYGQRLVARPFHQVQPNQEEYIFLVITKKSVSSYRGFLTGEDSFRHSYLINKRIFATQKKKDPQKEY